MTKLACSPGVTESCIVSQKMCGEVGITAQAYVVCMVCCVTSKLHQMLGSCCLGDDILVALAV